MGYRDSSFTFYDAMYRQTIPIILYVTDPAVDSNTPQIAKFMGPTWGPPGSCRPQMGPMLVPWTLLAGATLAIPWDSMARCKQGQSLLYHGGSHVAEPNGASPPANWNPKTIPLRCMLRCKCSQYVLYYLKLPMWRTSIVMEALKGHVKFLKSFCIS